MEEKRTIYQCVARGCDGCTVCSPKQEEWEKSWLVAGELDCDILKNKNGVIYIRQDHMNATLLSARTEVLTQANEKISNLLRTWSVEKGGYGILEEAITDIIKGMMNEK